MRLRAKSLFRHGGDNKIEVAIVGLEFGQNARIIDITKEMPTYDMPLYRPPSEGRSAIVQATLGCSHNKCSFCAMYRTKRFSIRPVEAIRADIDQVAKQSPWANRVFLADGDALVMPTEKMLEILAYARHALPNLDRVTSYAMPRNLIRKSADELRQIRASGLSMVYLGIETGDPTLLERITKGATREDIVEACRKAHEAGIKVSGTVLLGLGGRRHSERHIENTASLLSEIKIAYAAALTLTVVEPIADEFHEKFGESFEALTVPELLDEVGRLIKTTDSEGTIFRANHASNHLPIGGVLNKDKPELLELVSRAKTDPQMLRPEWARGL